MKKNRLYPFLIVFFVLALVLVFYKYYDRKDQQENASYGLLPRKGTDTANREWKEVQTKSNLLMTALQNEPNDIKAGLSLAALYIQEARVTGNHLYYDKAAMKYINNVLKIDSSNFNALVFKSLIYLSQHHFAEGLETANKAKKVNPYNAYVYGLMVDANIELGQYDSAVANADRMVAIRPDLTSYARVSYIREIFGDYKGSIDAMRMAVTAGGPGDENTEWTRVQLGQLYEKTGNFPRADTLYQSALNLRPNYPYALAGLGRIAMEAKNYPKAIEYFEKANALISDNGIKEELTDAYRLAGDEKKATATAEKNIEELAKDAQAGDDDETIGHYSDRELAYAYLKVNNPGKALEHAMLEYNRRPGNIDVNEAVAWVLYKKGDFTKALPYIETALRTKSKNPILLCRAALIYAKAGNVQQAKSLLQQTFLDNPYIGELLRKEVASVVQM